MTNRISFLWIAVIAALFAAVPATQAQSETRTIVTTTTTTITTSNNVVTTNVITTTTTNVTSGATTNITSTNAAATIAHLPKGGPAHPKLAVVTNGWKTSVAFGLTLARGNTDTTQASISATTQKKWLQNSLIFGADGLYGESKLPNDPKETESAEVLHGYSQYNRVFGDNFYGYGRVDGFHDGIADIKYRLTLAPGLGYYFVTNKTMTLMGEVGPGYIKEQLDGQTESFATLRAAEKFNYLISPNAKLWQTIEFLPQADHLNNYLINFELGLEAKLTKGGKLSVRPVLDDSYNNIPAAGRLKNDLKLITSLVYTF